MQVRDGMSTVVLTVGPPHSQREAARRMAEACRSGPGENPGMLLGASLGAEASIGRDKLTFVVDDTLLPHAGPARIEIVDSALTLLMPADARQRLAIKVTEALMPAAG